MMVVLLTTDKGAFEAALTFGVKPVPLTGS